MTRREYIKFWIAQDETIRILIDRLEARYYGHML